MSHVPLLLDTSSWSPMVGRNCPSLGCPSQPPECVDEFITLSKREDADIITLGHSMGRWAGPSRVTHILKHGSVTILRGGRLKIKEGAGTRKTEAERKGP